MFWTPEGSVCGRQILGRAATLAEKLPDRRSAAIVYERRDRFVTALLALWMRGQTAVLPADVVIRRMHSLRQEFPDIYLVAETPVASADRNIVLVDDAATEAPENTPPDMLAGELNALCIFTSGSTGQPSPNNKSWEILAASANPISAMIGLDRFATPSIVATVPSYHMYGFELTVLAVLGAGAAVHCERAVYPADIARCLQEIPSPRVLVTTPFHLRALMETKIDLPAVDHIVSATAPMALDFADSVEQRLGAPVYEIYGFTEAGSVAGRRTVGGAEWTLRQDLAAIDDNGDLLVECTTSGRRVPFPDIIDIVDSRHIRLRDRSEDIVNVAGKRASLAGLSAQLTQINGVEDGVFVLSSEDAGQGAISRLMVVVVSPKLTSEQIKKKLRECIEPAFLPRYIFHVEELPRNETGKLTRENLNRLVTAKLKGNGTAR